MIKKKIIKDFINIQENDTKVLDYPFRVIYKKVSNPITFIAFFTKVGSIYEDEKYKGISHLIEHCVFRGSKNYPSDISKIINSFGGYLNAYTSYDQTVYYINLPSNRIYEAMDILWDMVFEPLFREEDIESEKNIIFHEMEMRDDEPFVLLFEETLKNFYSINPIRYPIIGYRETLENIDKQVIVDFHSYYKIPDNSFFVIVTDHELKRVDSKLDKLFSSYRSVNKQFLNINYIDDEELNRGRMVLKGNVNKTYLMICYKAPTLLQEYKGIEKSYYFSLASYILGSSNYSIFNRILKNELKIVDSVNFDIYTTNNFPGIIYFSAITESSNVEKVIDKYLQIVRNLKSYIEVSYFEIVKENFLSSVFWNFETSANQGMLIGSNELFKSYKEAYNYLSKIESMNYKDLFEVFYNYISEDNFFISVYDKEQ